MHEGEIDRCREYGTAMLETNQNESDEMRREERCAREEEEGRKLSQGQ